MKTASKFTSSLSLAALCLSLPLGAESLYPVEEAPSMIANKVARARGDILTIIVSEATTRTNTHTTSTNIESEINNTVTRFLFSAAASGFGTHNGELPATQITGNNERTGGGTETMTQTLTDQVSVMVADVLPNGNLLIQGARKSSTNNEATYMVFSGIVRKYDITANNTIASNQIFDSKIEYISEGAISSAEEKGWLEKLNEVINPF